MIRTLALLVFLTGVFPVSLGLTGGTAHEAPPAAAAIAGSSHVDTVVAPSLRYNLLGDSHRRAATVYLPPAYTLEPRRRFPVVYLLHGFAADHRAFMRGAYQNLNVRISMDSLIRAGAVRDMIVVTPNARNWFDGSFYANSPVTGNWEDFVVRDLVRHMDRKYRTIANRSGRGISGHSMGGYGALRIAMRNPDVFSAVYAMSACCLNEMDAPERTQGWKAAAALRERSQYARAGFTANLLVAVAGVYSPNTRKPPFFVDLPYALAGDSLVVVPEVMARWRATPLAEVDQRVPALRRLAIAFDAGTRDALTDIPRNVRALDSILTRHDVPHTSELYDGTHGSRIRERFETKVMPFFSSLLR